MSHTTLKEATPWLEAHVREGLFTPFLGAGASSLRSGEVKLQSSPWKEVASTLKAIAFCLKTTRSGDFLRSFTEYRLGLSAEKASHIIPTVSSRSNNERTPLSEHILTLFGAELVRATVRLTQYFAVRFSLESPSIHHLEHCSVEFDLTAEEAVDALSQLLTAADIALELREDTCGEKESPFLQHVSGASRKLEAHRLHEKLLILIVELLGSNREDYHDRLRNHIDKARLGPDDLLDRLEGRASYFGRLRLDAIQWLSDLLWYSVRYWVPSYPTTAELAFELALAAKHVPPGRVELAQAAQALERERDSGLLARIVGDLVAYCEEAQVKTKGLEKQTEDFYRAIGAVISIQFKKYSSTLKCHDTTSSRRSLRKKFRLGSSTPIAFTTNYDSALERALETIRSCFHLVFPVIRKGSCEWGRESPIWLMQTHNLEEPCSEVVWSEICDDNGVPQFEWRGPMIVKLHGAPLVRLRDGFDHCIVLSEASYLRALKPPDWLERQLCSGEGWSQEQGRSLWFLGYSLSDWNIRYSLYGDGIHDKGVHRFVVTYDMIPHRQTILEELRVNQIVGDLNELTSILKDIVRADTSLD